VPIELFFIAACLVPAARSSAVALPRNEVRQPAQLKALVVAWFVKTGHHVAAAFGTHGLSRRRRIFGAYRMSLQPRHTSRKQRSRHRLEMVVIGNTV